MSNGHLLYVVGVGRGLLVGRGQFLLLYYGLSSNFSSDLLALGLLHLIGVEVLLLIPADSEVIFFAGWIKASKPGIPYTLLPVP